MRPARLLIAFVLLLCMSAGSLAGCGASGLKQASLVLDFTPNAVHTGIYVALAKYYDHAAGIRLHVTAPSASTDSIKLLDTGRTDFAILDIHDLALARERGQDIVGIMAIVQRPLAAVVAQPAIRSPSQLQGRLVGVTGLPSDTAVLDSIVAGAGGNPRAVHRITIGFNAVPDLLAGRVSGATAFWNDEGVVLQRTRPGFHIFRVEAYGAPSYPELVLCATRAFLRGHRSLAHTLVRVLQRGYRFTLEHPKAAAAALESQVPGLKPSLVSAELSALEPAFRPPGVDPVGSLTGVLGAWARWEARFGIVKRAPDVHRMFDNSFITESNVP